MNIMSNNARVQRIRRSSDPASLHIGWVIARIVFFISILMLIVWANLDGIKPAQLQTRANDNDVNPSTIRLYACNNTGADTSDADDGRISSTLTMEVLMLTNSRRLLAEVLGIDSRRALQMIEAASNFMREHLYPNVLECSRRAAAIEKMALSIETQRMSSPLLTIGHTIHMSIRHIQRPAASAASAPAANYDIMNCSSSIISCDAMPFEALLYKAMAHVWLWDGNGTAPLPLLDAIATFLQGAAGLAGVVRTTAGTYPLMLSNSIECGSTSSRTKSCENANSNYHEVSLQFIQFCESKKPGFVSQLNSKLAEDQWRPSLFRDIMGQSLEELLEQHYCRSACHLSSSSSSSSSNSSSLLTRDALIQQS